METEEKGPSESVDEAQSSVDTIKKVLQLKEKTPQAVQVVGVHQRLFELCKDMNFFKTFINYLLDESERESSISVD